MVAVNQRPAKWRSRARGSKWYRSVTKMPGYVRQSRLVFATATAAQAYGQRLVERYKRLKAAEVIDEPTDLDVIECACCQKEFAQEDILDFFCDDCRYPADCSCGSDDVTMDWHVTANGEPGNVYEISITCRVCEKQLRKPCGLSIFDETAKQVFDEWNQMPTEA